MGNCANCFYWSEMIAYARGTGPVKAMCLNDNSDNKGKMTTGKDGCDDWEDGSDGAIDLPHR